MDKNDRKCRWYQNDQGTLRRIESGFCDVGCWGRFLIFGESATNCEYAGNFSDVHNDFTT